MGAKFVGVYWAAREESPEEVSQRITAFLRAVAVVDASLETWFLKGSTRAAATTRLEIDQSEIVRRLRVNRRDDNGQQIPDLGYSLSVWNGAGVSLQASLGKYSPSVLNSVVLKFERSAATLDPVAWKRLLNAAIEAFNPEHGVVTDNVILTEADAKFPWEKGWLTYSLGGEVQEWSLA